MFIPQVHCNRRIGRTAVDRVHSPLIFFQNRSDGGVIWAMGSVKFKTIKMIKKVLVANRGEIAILMRHIASELPLQKKVIYVLIRSLQLLNNRVLTQSIPVMASFLRIRLLPVPV